MRELTMHELDAQLAVELPARELMGSCAYGGRSYRQPSQTQVVGSGNGNGNGNSYGLLNVLNGNLNGNLNGDGNIVVQR